MVVGQHQGPIVCEENISAIDDLFRIGNGLGPLRCSGVGLRIQVHAGQQCPCSGLVGSSVGIGSGSGEFSSHRIQFRLDEGEELCRCCLLWTKPGTDPGCLGREAGVSIEIHQHPILKGPHETRFCAHHLDIIRRCAGDPAGGQLIRCAFADELVTECYHIKTAVIQTRQEGVICAPVHIVKLPDVCVVPRDNRFVGTKLLCFPEQAQKV